MTGGIGKTIEGSPIGQSDPDEGFGNHRADSVFDLNQRLLVFDNHGGCQGNQIYRPLADGQLRISQEIVGEGVVVPVATASGDTIGNPLGLGQGRSQSGEPTFIDGPEQPLGAFMVFCGVAVDAGTKMSHRATVGLIQPRLGNRIIVQQSTVLTGDGHDNGIGSIGERTDMGGHVKVHASLIPP